ncbi:MAG: SMP-30/gluconolactonase/LRE family protein [Opitutales bacterium]
MRLLPHPLVFLSCLLATSVVAAPRGLEPDFPVAGSIERLDPRLDAVLDTATTIEVLAEGFTWSEGPVWLPTEDAVVFTDVPQNTAYRWSEADGLSIYLQPSGYTGEVENSLQEGANGLALDPSGALVLCQHGDRRVARMRAPLDEPAPVFETLAATWEGKRFNSPNDLAIAPDGTIYFTDPIYGLGPDAPAIAFTGVYRLAPDGTVTLLAKDQPMPNGVVLSAEEDALYIANSDSAAAIYTHLPLAQGATAKVFFDATALVGADNPGLPDGMALHGPSGLLFATGPGGVLVLDPSDPDDPHLGTIRTGKATANCTFNADGTVLYMTAHDTLMRVSLKGPPRSAGP